MAATLIADDLTGACDTGALLAGHGRVGVFVEPDCPDDGWEVAALDTESRGLPAPEAARKVGALARGLGGRLRGLLFKKIDSTLRGAAGAEIEAVRAAAGRRAALVCPAFPAQGRTVRQGILHVEGVPVHLSPIGRDPDFPARTSSVAEILAGGGGAASHLPLARVRGAPDRLARALAAAAGLVVADAETDADLLALARAALALPDLLLAGSAGLGGALALALGQRPAPVPLPEGRAWLIVVGSRHPASRAQIGALEAAGVAAAWIGGATEPDPGPLAAALMNGEPALVASRPEPADHRDIAARLARLAAGVLARARADLVAATGGETAVALFRALGARRLELLGAPSSGLALGDLVAPGAARPLLTKAGGFGPPDLFPALLEATA